MTLNNPFIARVSKLKLTTQQVNIIDSWCWSNLKGFNYLNQYAWIFEDPTEYTLFMLRWGDVIEN